MTDNQLLTKLRSGQTVFGTWSMTGSPSIINIIGLTGLDFIIFDMEHGSMSFETADNMVRAAECTGCQSIVRVPDASEATILRALETGSRGIMVPHVSTVAEAEKIVTACKYSPEGARGLSPYTRNHDYDHEDIAESMAANNRNTLAGVLVEGKKGIANLAEIAAVEGLDLIYTGIYDISQSIGLPGQLTHPDVLDVQKKCFEAVKQYGIAAGSFARDEEYIKLLVNNGCQFIAYSVDAYVLKTAYLSKISAYRQYVSKTIA